MAVQSDLRAAAEVFVARLDDANERFNRAGTGDTAASMAYVSTQTKLLTELSVAFITSINELADGLDRLEWSDGNRT